MIVDKRPVFIVDCVMVRCNECVRQVSVYVGTGVGHDLDTQLGNLGWWVEGDRHLCQEHG